MAYWNPRDKAPFWSQKIRGDDAPSSITFVDGGLVIGRKHGTLFQLLPSMSKNISATVRFVNGDREDNEMFGHANYDSKIQTLWVANNRRDSMIAFKLGFESTIGSSGGDETRGYFEQVVEFAGPKPTIHFVILTPDADPTGDEAHAACVAAKVPPGELALVAFSVHSSGVDQVLIRREWFDGALASTPAKFPSVAVVPPTQPIVAESRNPRSIPQHVPIAVAQTTTTQAPAAPSVTRLRTPPSEDVEADLGRDETRAAEGRNKGKGKNVGWRDKDDIGKEKAIKASEVSSNESVIGTAMAKEIKKMEENLYSRIGRLVGKELDKQRK